MINTNLKHGHWVITRVIIIFGKIGWCWPKPSETMCWWWFEGQSLWSKVKADTVFKSTFVSMDFDLTPTSVLLQITLYPCLCTCANWWFGWWWWLWRGDRLVAVVSIDFDRTPSSLPELSQGLKTPGHHQDKHSHVWENTPAMVWLISNQTKQYHLHVFDLYISKAGSWVSEKVESEDAQVWIFWLEENNHIIIGDTAPLLTAVKLTRNCQTQIKIFSPGWMSMWIEKWKEWICFHMLKCRAEKSVAYKTGNNKVRYLP